MSSDVDAKVLFNVLFIERAVFHSNRFPYPKNCSLMILFATATNNKQCGFLQSIEHFSIAIRSIQKMV